MVILSFRHLKHRRSAAADVETTHLATATSEKQQRPGKHLLTVCSSGKKHSPYEGVAFFTRTGVATRVDEIFGV